MSRILLFTQAGDARPKCRWRLPAFLSHEGAQEALRGPDDFNWLPRPILTVWRAADNWWIVECDNAKAGRFIIASAMCPERLGHIHGRILASGGRP